MLIGCCCLSVNLDLHLAPSPHQLRDMLGPSGLNHAMHALSLLLKQLQVEAQLNGVLAPTHAQVGGCMQGPSSACCARSQPASRQQVDRLILWVVMYIARALVPGPPPSPL